MRLAVQDRLREINRTFYATVAPAFAGSRSSPAPGFRRLLPWLPNGPIRLLDVGCGEGRLGRFLHEELDLTGYVGVDQETALLERARAGLDDALAPTFLRRDLSQPGALAGVRRAPLIACLATLQHIPGHAARLRLLRELASRLEPGGRLWLSSWQYLDSSRQRRKLLDWSVVGLTERDVEPGDHLLRWERDGQAIRYVASLDEARLASLAAVAGLAVRHRFRSDGREGNLNLYLVLAPAERRR